MTADEMNDDMNDEDKSLADKAHNAMAEGEKDVKNAWADTKAEAEKAKNDVEAEADKK
jgi:hypothetical protein